MKIIFTIKVEGKHMLCTYNLIKSWLFLCCILILKIIISIAVVQAVERGLERRVINFLSRVLGQLLVMHTAELQMCPARH